MTDEIELVTFKVTIYKSAEVSFEEFLNKSHIVLSHAINPATKDEREDFMEYNKDEVEDELLNRKWGKNK